jgi:UDP-N-acetylmuramyl pentapeptide phosphotransferase/UDP-N-acetylglucosamine-1-phosphate transferase
MDGIDGLLAAQAIFVFAVAAAVFHAGARDSAFVAALIGAGATAGFVPFNFPRARIFMGDVGSGVLGLLVAIVILAMLVTPQSALATGAVACSAFVTDATCTLLSRMLRGRRWYSAHREHLYQWLVRGGFSHARVVALYTGWNVLIALPVIGWMNRWAQAGADRAPDDGIEAAAAIYVLAVLVWWQGKQWCLRRALARRRPC